MDEHSNLAVLDKLKTRIQALRAKTIENGCTVDEALSAAANPLETAASRQSVEAGCRPPRTTPLDLARGENQIVRRCCEF